MQTLQVIVILAILLSGSCSYDDKKECQRF